MLAPYFAPKPVNEEKKKKSKKLLFALSAGDKSAFGKGKGKRGAKWAKSRVSQGGQGLPSASGSPSKGTSTPGASKGHPKYKNREEMFNALSQPRIPVPPIRVVRPKKERFPAIGVNKKEKQQDAIDLNASAPAAMISTALSGDTSAQAEVRVEGGEGTEAGPGDGDVGGAGTTDDTGGTFLTDGAAFEEETPTDGGDSPRPRRLPAIDAGTAGRRPRPKTVGYTGSVLHRKTPATPVSKLGRTYADTVLPMSPAVAWLSTRAREHEKNGVSEYVKEVETVVGIPSTFIDELFRTRCTELKVKPDVLRAQRFISVLENTCKDKHLDVHETGLGTESAIALCHALSMDEHYTSLDISANLIRDGGAMAVAHLIAVNPRLTVLDLRSNSIGPVGGQALFDALKINSTITHLDLSAIHGVNRNNVADKVCPTLSDVMVLHPQLHTLSLGSNGITDVGAEALMSGLQEAVSLVHLDLSGNKLGPRGCSHICQAMRSSRVKKLILHHNGIGDLGCLAVEDMLKYTGLQLEYLDLSDNDIEWKGGGMLGQAMALNNSLHTLILSNNKIGNLASIELATSLKGQPTLRTLHMSNCFLTSDSTDEWTFTLNKDGTGLSRLDFSNNELGDQGGVDFARGIQHAESLTYLDLSNTTILDRGGIALAKALKVAPSLHTLKFKENPMGDQAGQTFLDSIKSNPNLRLIDFGFNGFSFGLKQSIDDAVKRNMKAYVDSRPAIYRAEKAEIEQDLESFDEILKELTREQQELREAEELLTSKRALREQSEMLVEKNMQVAEKRLLMIKERTIQYKTSLQETTEQLSKQKTSLHRQHERLGSTLETETLNSNAAASRLQAVEAEFEGFDLLRQGQLEEEGRALVALEKERDVAKIEAEALEAQLAVLLKEQRRNAARGKRGGVPSRTPRGETVLVTDPVTGKQRRAVKQT